MYVQGQSSGKKGSNTFKNAKDYNVKKEALSPKKKDLASQIGLHLMSVPNNQ